MRIYNRFFASIGIFFFLISGQFSNGNSVEPSKESSFQWKNENDNWIPQNLGFELPFRFRSLVVFEEKFTTAFDSHSNGKGKPGIYQFNNETSKWIQIAPSVTKYGTSNLFVIGEKENAKLISFREKNIYYLKDGKWKSFKPLDFKITHLASHPKFPDYLYASSVEKNKVRIFRFDLKAESWKEIPSKVLPNANSQHVNLTLSANGNLFISYIWNAKSIGNIGTKKDPNYKGAVFIYDDSTFRDITQNADGSRGLHLGNMTNAINPGPLGGVYADPVTNEIYVSTEQGVFVRENFAKDSHWELVFHSWGNQKVEFAASKIILTKKQEIQVWDNELNLGSSRRLSYQKIGQSSAYNCKYNSIKDIQSIDGIHFLAYLETAGTKCNKKTKEQIGFVRLTIDPSKKKSSYNLDLDFAGYHAGKESKEAIGIIALPEGRIVLAFNQNGKGKIEIREGLGKKLIYQEDYTSPIRDIAYKNDAPYFAITGDFGSFLYPTNDNYMKKVKLGYFGNAIDISKNGSTAILQGKRVLSLDSYGKLISERTLERSYLEDIAIHPNKDTIVVVGFDNKKRKNVPVQVAFATAFDSKKLTNQKFQTWGFSGEQMGSDMADTRIYRVVYGENNKLYILGETAGGNTAFRWNGKDLQTETIITTDLYNTGFQTRSEHKMYYAEINENNGQVVRGQMTFPRTSSNNGNTNRAKDASIAIDTNGTIYIGSGGTAYALEARNLKRFNGSKRIGTYSGGDMSVLIVSDSMKERIVWTAFAKESSQPGGGSIPGIALSSDKVIILGTSREGYLIDHNSDSYEGFQSEPMNPSKKDEKSNLYLSIFEKP